MAVYGAMSALGITIGVLLGGVLTGLLSWRWVFFINIPVGLAVLAGSGVLVDGQRNAGRLDTPGATTGTGAMVALTYGITHAGEHGWSNLVTVVALNLAFALAVLFVVLQARRADPCCRSGCSATATAQGPMRPCCSSALGLWAPFTC
jgi:MFS family permease